MEGSLTDTEAGEYDELLVQMVAAEALARYGTRELRQSKYARSQAGAALEAEGRRRACDQTRLRYKLQLSDSFVQLR